MAFLSECFTKAAGSEAVLGKYTNATGEELANYYLIQFSPIDFNDYIG